MRYVCTPNTDIDELVGRDEVDGFRPGPLSVAMKRGEELELVASGSLSAFTKMKLALLTHGLVLIETGESILPTGQFELILN